MKTQSPQEKPSGKSFVDGYRWAKKRTALSSVRECLIDEITRLVKLHGLQCEDGSVAVPMFDGCNRVLSIEHGTGNVWQVSLKNFKKTEVPSGTPGVFQNIVVETDLAEYRIDELYADDIESIAVRLGQMTADDFEACRQHHEEMFGWEELP